MVLRERLSRIHPGKMIRIMERRGCGTGNVQQIVLNPSKTQPGHPMSALIDSLKPKLARFHS